MKTESNRRHRPAMNKAMSKTLFVVALIFFSSCLGSNTGGKKAGENIADKKINGGICDTSEVICATPEICEEEFPLPPVPEQKKGNDAKKVVIDNNIYPISAVQISPEFPGGIEKFRRYIIDNISGSITTEPCELRMQFRFVIEKDGKLTDVQILDDGDDPKVAAKGVETLGDSPRWKPGILNGKPVRTAFILPVIIPMQNGEK